MIKIIKLDGRFSGYPRFMYRATFKHPRSFGERISRYEEVRQWCWKTWGPSCLLEHHSLVELCSPSWAWKDGTNFKDIFIYLKSEEEKNWFQLRWSGE